MKIRCCYLLVCSLAVASGARGDTLTLDDFLERLRANHPFIAKEKLAPKIEKASRDALRGGEDWVLASSPFYSYEEPLSAGFSTAESRAGYGADLSATRNLWSAGGRFSLAFSTRHIDQEFQDSYLPVTDLQGQNVIGMAPLSGGPSELFQSRLTATYSHPLLKNRNGVLDRLAYDLADFAAKAADIRSFENREGFLAELGLRFLDWVLITKQVKIAADRLRLSEAQLAQIRKRRAANLVERVDLLRAEDAVRIARRNRLLLESRWKALQAELATAAQAQTRDGFRPAHDTRQLPPAPAADKAAAEVGQNSRLIRALATLKKQSQQKRKALTSAAKPSLNLALQAGLQQEDEAFDKSMELEKPNASISLQFRYPWGNSGAASEIDKANLQIRQISKEMESVALSLKATARSLAIQMRELRKVMRLDQEQIESALERTKEEQKRYEQGRGDLTFVIQSRDNEQLARLTTAQNRVLYHKLALRYRELMDRLLPENGERAP